MKVEVSFADDGAPIASTLDEFFEANADGIEAEERRQITDVLLIGGTYHGGGGAEAEWSIRRAA